MPKSEINWRKSRAAPVTFGGTFDVPKRQEKIAEMEQTMAGEGFWDNQEAANKIVTENYGVKLKQFKESLDGEISNMLSQSGGLTYSKNTLSTLLGLFQTMKQQMEEESEKAICTQAGLRMTK